MFWLMPLKINQKGNDLHTNHICVWLQLLKKSLKIPKRQSESVNRKVGQTTQWPKEKLQKDKQRSTKHTCKTKDRVARTPLKTGGELRCSLNLKLPSFSFFWVHDAGSPRNMSCALTYISTHEDIDKLSRFLNPSTPSDIKEVA